MEDKTIADIETERGNAWALSNKPAASSSGDVGTVRNGIMDLWDANHEADRELEEQRDAALAALDRVEGELRWQVGANRSLLEFKTAMIAERDSARALVTRHRSKRGPQPQEGPGHDFTASQARAAELEAGAQTTAMILEDVVRQKNGLEAEVERLKEEIARLKARRAAADQLAEVVGLLEWGRKSFSDEEDDWGYVCPVCSEEQIDGHSEACLLRMALDDYESRPSGHLPKRYRASS